MQKLEKELMEPEKEDNFGCVRCGKCCTYSKDNLLALNFLDIRRIENATGLKEDEFSERHWHRPKFKVLKTVYDPEDKEHYCMFLEKGEDGRKSCSIYENRPWMCKYYPFGGKCQNGRYIQRGVHALVALFMNIFVG